MIFSKDYKEITKVFTKYDRQPERIIVHCISPSILPDKNTDVSDWGYNTSELFYDLVSSETDDNGVTMCIYRTQSEFEIPTE